MESVLNSLSRDREYIVMDRPAIEARNAPFSDAVLVGSTLYIGGHIGIDLATGRPGETPEREADLLMEALRRTVEAADMSMDDLVYVQVFCSDVSLYEIFNQVYRGYFSDGYPARAFLGTGNLLVNARFQLTGLAVKREPAGRSW